MRDRRFIAVHRGGPLKKEQHIQLMLWGVKCAENVLPLFSGAGNRRLLSVLSTARAWADGDASVGDCRKAAVEAIVVANNASDPVSVAIARAAGHAAATAHMADHSLGGALYALKAVKLAGGLVDEERKWQNDRIPDEIKELVLSSRSDKEKYFRLL
jgi:hypothetical protein